MAQETRPTQQGITTTPTTQAGSGKNVTKRILVDDTLKSTTIPDKVGGVLIYNEGANDVALYMGGSSGNDYFPIKVGADPIYIPLNDSVTVGVKCATGLTATLRCLFY